MAKTTKKIASGVKAAAGKPTEPAPDPSVKSMAYTFMEPKWAMIQALLGGTYAMRAAEREYLPQHAEESQENYNERLNRDTLFNMFELTLDSLVGKPFVEPVKLNSDVPDQISNSKTGFAKNIDLQGNDISSFSREWLRDAIAKGFSHVLIDMPVLKPDEKVLRTYEDDLNENRRPYWTLIRPEKIIFAHADVVNGVETLTHVRILEDDMELVGFQEVITPRIRILEPGLWQLWELHEKEDQKDPVWEMIESGTSDLPYIPLVTFYSSRTGFMTAKPPLEDLGHLNVRHWQSTSDQINVLTVARFPMLAVAGAQLSQGQEENMAIGPRQLLATRDANGKFYYVEHSGKAIAAGESDLEKLEDKMATYGAEFLRRKIGGRTATERALDSSEAISPLKDITQRFMVSMNQALKITADWIKIADGGTVDINTDFTEEDINTAALTMLTEARKRGDISRYTFLMELRRQEVIAADTDVPGEMRRIEEEAKTLLIKPTFVTASEQIRSMENVMSSDDQTPTDILNDVPGPGDNKTQNDNGVPAKPATQNNPQQPQQSQNPAGGVQKPPKSSGEINPNKGHGQKGVSLAK